METSVVFNIDRLKKPFINKELHPFMHKLILYKRYIILYLIIGKLMRKNLNDHPLTNYFQLTLRDHP